MEKHDLKDEKQYLLSEDYYKKLNECNKVEHCQSWQ